MRQLTFVQPNVVEWREVADPMLQGDSEALVRPMVVANCDVDGLIITGRFPVPGPFALGHELDRKSTRLNSSHSLPSRMPSSA